MSRVFGRGQLKLALLEVTADLGTANGYAIMHALADRIGGSWQPSPGAIYPALLALEDEGLIRGQDEDGARRYAVTPAGQRSLSTEPDVITAVADRVRQAPAPATTVGAVLDRLASEAPNRRHALQGDDVRRLEDLYRPVLEEIERITAQEAP